MAIGAFSGPVPSAGLAGLICVDHLFIPRFLFYTGARRRWRHYSRGGVQFPTGGNYRLTKQPVAARERL